MLRAVFVAGAICLTGFIQGCGPDPAEQALVRGDSLFNRMDFAGAVAEYDAAVAAAPEYAEAYFARGRAQWAQSKHARAVADFSRALELDPDRPEAYFLRANSFMMLRDFEAGLDDLDAALSSGALQEQDVIRAYRLRGIGLMNLERYSEAIGAYNGLIERQPTLPANFIDRARLYEATGQPAEALADYHSALEWIETESQQAAAVRKQIERLEATN